MSLVVDVGKYKVENMALTPLLFIQDYITPDVEPI